ncbi:hypothetical protein QYZ88_002025 [Lachnospiraceae bacterium C1.1]|nr:hypothetical protein [Lachnospiraceae bacterium C1.1]
MANIKGTVQQREALAAERLHGNQKQHVPLPGLFMPIGLGGGVTVQGT